MNIRAMILRCHWILGEQFGFDPRKMFRSLQGMPRYARDFLRFRANHAGRIDFVPCLHDWYEEGGSTKSEYFWQDLLVARKIFAAAPEKHIDIGSRIDGFVAHVASFREIEVFDVRPVTTDIPGIAFKQANLMQSLEGLLNYCDSLSCLHALEHFGLGRYGDPIDPHGFEHGIANMSKLLTRGGTFYLSVPVGIERVEFNANRVFDPRTILRAAEKNGLSLTELTVIQSGGRVIRIASDDAGLANLANQQYALGIFIFRKEPKPEIESGA